MGTVVLAIDRDNDLGQKAGVEGPVVGREANIEAAESLGLSDPEDSDINTIFQAVKLAEEMDAEVATITGHPSVGMESDRTVADQLDDVLKEFDEAVVVTDGAEDEFVMPLVESRIKVSSVKRVIVNQSQNLETTYYIVKRVLDDPRFLKRFFIPIGLVSLAYSLLSLAGLQAYAVSGILGVLGIYLVNRAARLDARLREAYSEILDSLLAGRVSFLGYFAGAVLIVVGAVRGYYSAGTTSTPQGAIWGEEVLFQLAGALVVAVWWWVSAVIAVSLGRLVDEYLDERRLDERLVVLPFFAGALALLVWGGSEYVLNPSFGGRERLLFGMGAGVLLGAVGLAASKSLKRAGWTVRPSEEIEGHSG